MTLKGNEWLQIMSILSALSLWRVEIKPLFNGFWWHTPEHRFYDCSYSSWRWEEKQNGLSLCLFATILGHGWKYSEIMMSNHKSFFIWWNFFFYHSRSCFWFDGNAISMARSIVICLSLLWINFKVGLLLLLLYDYALHLNSNNKISFSVVCFQKISIPHPRGNWKFQRVGEGGVMKRFGKSG